MTDKKYHVLAGLLVAAFVGLPCYLESINLFAGLWSALAGGFVAAAVKEWCDTKYCLDPSKWDWRDIGATMLGAAVVALGILLMHYAKG